MNRLEVHPSTRMRSVGFHGEAGPVACSHIVDYAAAEKPEKLPCLGESAELPHANPPFRKHDETHSFPTLFDDNRRSCGYWPTFCKPPKLAPPPSPVM